MPWIRPMLYAYAVITALIGTYGYVHPLLNPSPDHKPSIISMVAGLVIGALVAGGAYLSLTKRMVGFTLCLLGCILVLGQFAPKFFKDTSLIFPAGLMTILSLAVVAAMVGGHFAAQKSKA